jgi:hypothetical protein
VNTSPNRAPRPRLIYWVHIAILIPSLAAFVYLWISLALKSSTPSADIPVDHTVQLLISLIISPLTVAVGLYCIRRAPGNVVGVMLAIWGCAIVEIIALDKTPWILGLGTLLAGIIWPGTFFLFSYFPDGRIYPPRLEKWLDRLVILTYIGGIFVGLTTEYAIARGNTPNPLYVSALTPFGPLFSTIDFGGAFIAIAYGIISSLMRFRAANRRVRQQIKWLTWGFVPLGFLMVLQVLVVPAIPELKPFSDALGYLLQLWLMVFPVIAIGNAILRHRLYDIDIIIRRTLVYSILTGILAAIYFGGVLMIQRIFQAAVGSTPDVAIVISTLVIAALFTPIRRRVQDTIDRRFYRRKYDAEKTLAKFSQSLRDEVDIETLKDSLVSVVQETMQPTNIALWMPEMPPK